MPVACSNVAPVVCGDASTIDDNSKDDESQYSNDLDQRKDKFDFTISSNAEDLYANKEHQEDGDPNADVYVRTPILNGYRGGRQFKR